MYFLAFLHIVTVDLNTHLEHLGEVVFGQCPYDPLPFRLELIQGQRQDRQLPLQPREQDCWCQVRRDGGGMGKKLDLFFGQELLNFLGSVNLCIVPVE